MRKQFLAHPTFLVLPVTAIGGITEEERERLRVNLSSILNKDDCLFLDVDDDGNVIAGILGGTYWGRSMNLASHFVDEPKKSSAFFLTVLRL